MKQSLLIAILATLSAFANAGGSDRGGGHAYVCFENAKDRDSVTDTIVKNRKSQSKDDPFQGINIAGLKVTVLDYFHAANLVGAVLITPTEGTVEQIVEERLKLLASKTTFGDVILDLYKKETRPSLWVGSKSGITEVDDSAYPLLIDNNCLQIQMALQDDYNIYFDTRLRTRLDVLNDVALVLHETFYRYARSRGHENSISVRYLVAKMITKDFEKMSGIEINQMLEKIKLASVSEYVGQGTKEFLVGNGKSITLDINYQTYGYNRQWNPKDLPNIFAGNRSAEDWAFLWTSTLVNGVPLLGTHGGYESTAAIFFDKKNQIYAGNLSENFLFKTMTLKKNSYVAFYSDEKNNYFGEKLLAGMLAENALIDGIMCAKDNYFHLYMSGRLKSCVLAQPTVVNGISIIPSTEYYGSPYYTEFYDKESQRLKIFLISKDTQFKRRGFFSTTTCDAKRRVVIDEEGFVTECSGHNFPAK